MNSRGFTLIELLVVSAGMAIVLLALSSIFQFASRQTTEIVTKGDAQVELNEIHRDIRKAINARKSDEGSDPLEILDVEAFPSTSSTCPITILDPPCTGLYIRQTSPLDPSGNTIRVIRIESSCEELPLANRSDIPENLQLTAADYPNYHPALCCPDNTLPIIRIRTIPNEALMDKDNTDVVYPYRLFGAAACFRLKEDSVSSQKISISVELVGLAPGPQTGSPVAIEKTETISLIRNSNVEILPN